MNNVSTIDRGYCVEDVVKTQVLCSGQLDVCSVQATGHF